MAKRAGNPQEAKRAGKCDQEAARSRSLTAQRMREEFEGMPAAKQRETVELVERCLDDERRDIMAQRRRAPSPLARLAFEVYGISVPWVIAQDTPAQLEPRRNPIEVVL